MKIHLKSFTSYSCQDISQDILCFCTLGPPFYISLFSAKMMTHFQFLYLAGKQRKARFYVYCKSQCNEAQPGKLRVRCGSCMDEAFTISRVLFISFIKIWNKLAMQKDSG